MYKIILTAVLVLGFIVPVYADRPSILFFTASGCGPCEAMKPHWKTKSITGIISKRYNFYSIHNRDRPDLVRKWGIRAFPTTIITGPRDDDGADELKRHTGYLSEKNLGKFLD